MNIAHIGTDTIAPRFPHLHPDALDERDRRGSAMREWVEAYITDWQTAISTTPVRPTAARKRRSSSVIHPLWLS